MGRRKNDLFIGADSLTLDGASIKYYGLIKYFASLNVNKIGDTPIKLMGLDLETNYKTAELKLLGFYDDKHKYGYYTSDFIERLYSHVRYCYNNDMSLAFWNRLDPFVLFKEWLNSMNSDDEIERSMKHYGKISGEWNKRDQEWTVRPVATYTTRSGHEFGILNVIRSSVQFYFKHPDDEDINRVWGYDIAALYHYGLEREALGKLNPETGLYEGGRLDYYTKVDESAHLVDWNRFYNDKDYRVNIVLESNKLDAKAVKDLGRIIQEEFYNAFGYYPRSLVSQGSLARAAIVASLNNKYNEDEKLVNKDLKAIGINNFYSEWVRKFGGETVKELMSLSTEAYSGGYIESTRYGYAKECYYSDIASAYPSIIVKLYDIRGAKLTKGNGIPPHIPKSYCFIRGIVNIPDHIHYHSITVKNPYSKETNIRAVGTYKAAYIIEERDYLESLGATFTNETWVNVETKGKLSPLAEVAQEFIDLRTKLRKEGNSAEYMAKIAVNSMYGILFEAVDTYLEKLQTKEVDIAERFTLYKAQLKPYRHNINLDSIMSELKALHDKESYYKMRSNWYNKQGVKLEDVIQDLEYQGIYFNTKNLTDAFKQLITLWENDKHTPELKKVDEYIVKKEGYRAGEFFNSIFATQITALSRLKMAKRANYVESKGGKVILLMTDSVFHTIPKGSKVEDIIPPDDWKDTKTLGYFEKAERITDFICLGSGRYGYTDSKGRQQTKQRGLNSASIHDSEGILLEDFDWFKTLQNISSENGKLKLQVKALLSVGYVLNNTYYKYWCDDEKRYIESTMNYKSLGRVIKTVKELDVIVGKSKRMIPVINDTSILAEKLIDTTPIYLDQYKFGLNEVLDLAYVNLRNQMLELQCLPQEKINKQKRNVNAKKYYEKNKEKKKAQLRKNYAMLREVGYEPYEAGLLSQKSESEVKKICKKKK